MKIILAVLAFATLTLFGCTDAQMQQDASYGSKHHVTLYASDGHIIKQWVATGNVANEAQSDGWYFKDEATGKLVEVSGTVLIEQE